MTCRSIPCVSWLGPCLCRYSQLLLGVSHSLSGCCWALPLTVWYFPFAVGFFPLPLGIMLALLLNAWALSPIVRVFPTPFRDHVGVASQHLGFAAYCWGFSPNLPVGISVAMGSPPCGISFLLAFAFSFYQLLGSGSPLEPKWIWFYYLLSLYATHHP